MKILRRVFFVLLAGTPAFAQIPVLNQASFNGKFNFVYGVYERSSASVVMGSLNFDGQGKYTASIGTTAAQGFYRVNTDGTGSFMNPLDPTLPPLSLRIAAGVALIGGSTLEQSTADRHDLLIALPAPSSPPAMAGNWGGVTYLYAPGTAPFARAGRFRFAFDASGNTNSTTWTYHESDQNSGAPQDITSAGTYSVDATGFGTWTNSQGNKKIAVSADGNSFVGTDANSQEMIFASRLASGSVNSPGLQGRYWWLQLNAASPSGGGGVRSSDFAWSLTNGLQLEEGRGLARASGSGLFIDGPTGRLLDLANMLGPFTISPDSTAALTFGGLSSPGIGVMAANNSSLPFTNLSATATGNYSFSVVIQAPSFQPAPGQTVFLTPTGRCRRRRQVLIHFHSLREHWLWRVARAWQAILSQPLALHYQPLWV